MMAAENPAKRLKGETTCFICLDYFTDPVTIDCGHNFCCSCITQSWEGRNTNFPCPQCRETSQKRNLRPNRQLANLIEIARKLCQNSMRPKKKNLCEKHEEKLKLFCEEDQKAICVVCNKSRKHRSHTVIPIKEVVQEYKNKLNMYLEPLRKQLEDLLNFKSAEEKKAEKLRSETEIQRQKVECEFEELHKFLNKEKQVLLLRLEEEEKKILQKVGENVAQLEKQTSSLTQLISEIEEKNRQPAAKLLKDVKDTLSRCLNRKFPELEAVSADLNMVFELSFPHLLKKLDTFGDWWMECGRHTVDVTLDPETAHPNLILSEDQKSVRWADKSQNLLDNPKRFIFCPSVLGCEGFTSGRHYWEVDVGDAALWMLGVCEDSAKRKEEMSLSPGEGYWTVALWDGGGYWALTFPRVLLSLTESPKVVGILLDYEAGKISFYNADNRSQFYIFIDTFTGKLRPFFSTVFHEVPLTICPVSA